MRHVPSARLAARRLAGVKIADRAEGSFQAGERYVRLTSRVIGSIQYQ
jgi:hypothetical protein